MFNSNVEKIHFSMQEIGFLCRRTYLHAHKSYTHTATVCTVMHIILPTLFYRSIRVESKQISAPTQQ